MTIRPMLAHDAQKKLKHVKLPCYVQPKLDGCRWIWDGEAAVSRTGKPFLGIPRLSEFLADTYQGFPLDGELYVHGKSFQSFLGDIRRDSSKEGREENLEVAYHIYDLPIPNVPFAERTAMLRERVVETDRLKVVETRYMTKSDIGEELNPERMLKRLDVFTALGYEGTMYRSPEGLYLPKRSDGLLKIKTFMEDEFYCVGTTKKIEYEKLEVPEGTPGSKPRSDNGKDAGKFYKDVNPKELDTVGALIFYKVPKTVPPEGTEFTDENTFQSGSGLDDVTRDEFFENSPAGKWGTVKFFEWTDDGKPRFPIFKAIREDY